MAVISDHALPQDSKLDFVQIVPEFVSGKTRLLSGLAQH